MVNQQGLVSVDYIDARSARDRIRDAARAAAGHPEPFRRRAIMGLMRERHRSILSAADPRSDQPPCCTEEEVFYNSYGDATGREYWNAWLFPGKVAAEGLAWLLAAHVSRGDEEFECVRKTLSEALTPIRDVPAREMVAHLLEDPDTRRFVPASLVVFIAGDVARTTRGRTGAPGRPSSMHLVEIEFRRRHAAGEVHGTLKAEAEYLEVWLRRTYPASAPATAKSISNRTAAIYRQLMPRPKI